MSKLLGAVICGGKSNRMGMDKNMLLHLSGATFLQHACFRLRSVCDQVAICVDAETARERSVADTIKLVDAQSGGGPAFGVAAALQHASENDFVAVVVTPVDMPNLSSEHLRILVNRWRDDPDRPTCFIHPADGRWQPLACVYPVGFLDSIIKLTQSEDRSLMNWLRQNQPQICVVPAMALLNVNRPEDIPE